MEVQNMEQENQKSIVSVEEQAEFAKWVAEQKAQNIKITVRSVKAGMKCGQVKAEAYLRQYQDDETRVAIEYAQMGDVPDDVLNAISKYINTQVSAVANKMIDQVKAAEQRAAEQAETIEIAESTRDKANAQLEVVKEARAKLEGQVSVLQTQIAEYKAQIAEQNAKIDKLTEALQAAQIKAASAEASLLTMKEQTQDKTKENKK